MTKIVAEPQPLLLGWDAGRRGVRLVNGQQPVPGRGSAFGFGGASSKRRLMLLDFRSRWHWPDSSEWEYVLYSLPCRWWMRLPAARQIGWRWLIWRQHHGQREPVGLRDVQTALLHPVLSRARLTPPVVRALSPVALESWAAPTAWDVPPHQQEQIEGSL